MSTVWSNLELEYTCFESNVCLLVCVFSISSMNVRSFFPPLFWLGGAAQDSKFFSGVVVILLLNYGFLLGWWVFVSAAARG